METKLATRNSYTEVPTLSRVLNFVGLLPKEGVFMGVATDQLPVLLNAHSIEPCNIVVWDKLVKQGLRILKVIAEYIFSHRKNSEMIEFVVLTRYPEDWGELNKYGMGISGKTSCIGIIPFYSEIADQVVHGLATWINERHGASKSPVIVLIDGLNNIQDMQEDFKLDLRYILLEGHKKNVYTVATASKKDFAKVQYWLEGFHLEIYGCTVEHLFEYECEKEKIYFITPETEMI